MSKLNCFDDIIFSWILLVSMWRSFKPTLQVKESLQAKSQKIYEGFQELKLEDHQEIKIREDMKVMGFQVGEALFDSNSLFFHLVNSLLLTSLDLLPLLNFRSHFYGF